MPNLKWGPATVIVVALVTIVALAGAVVVITNPQTLDFQHYVNVLVGAAVATGLLGIGRGHATAAEKTADAAVTAALATAGADVPGRTEGVKAEGFEPPPDIAA